MTERNLMKKLSDKEDSTLIIKDQIEFEKETFITLLSKDTIQVQTIYHVNSADCQEFASDSVDINATIKKDTISIKLNGRDILGGVIREKLIFEVEEQLQYIAIKIPENIIPPYEIELQFQASNNDWLQEEKRKTSPVVGIAFPYSKNNYKVSIELLSEIVNWRPALRLGQCNIFEDFFSKSTNPFKKSISNSTDKGIKIDKDSLYLFNFIFREVDILNAVYKEDITLYPHSHIEKTFDIQTESEFPDLYFAYELGPTGEGYEYTVDAVEVKSPEEQVFRDADRVNCDELEEKARSGKVVYCRRKHLNKEIVVVKYNSENPSLFQEKTLKFHSKSTIKNYNINLNELKYYGIKEYVYLFAFSLEALEQEWNITIYTPGYKILETDGKYSCCSCCPVNLSNPPESCIFNFKKLEETEEGLVLKIISDENFHNMSLDKCYIFYLRLLLLLSFFIIVGYFPLKKYKKRWIIRILEIGKNSKLNKLVGWVKKFPITRFLIFILISPSLVIFVWTNERLFVYLNSFCWFYFLLLAVTIVIYLEYPLEKQKRRKKRKKFAKRE